jgi:DNA helicase-2/ATP-dependent DNA helicase PcrA
VRSSWGVPNELPGSRFLDDIPEDLVEWRRRESSMQLLRAGAKTRGDWSDNRLFPGSTRAAHGTAGRVRTSTPPSPGTPTPTFGSATPRPEGQVASLEVGDRVTHDAYGLGSVVALEGTGASTVAKVDFGAAGTKRLLLRYSPVTKI